MAKRLRDSLEMILGPHQVVIIPDGPQGSGFTVEGILRADRSDGTESLLLMAPTRRVDGHWNVCGMAMVLALLGQFKKLPFWARDLIILFPSAGGGTEAWLEAYHSVGGLKGSNVYNFKSLTASGRPIRLLRSGIIQAGLSLELSGWQCKGGFTEWEVQAEGPGGLLPNLDLVNLALRVGASHEMRPIYGSRDWFPQSLLYNPNTWLNRVGGKAAGMSHYARALAPLKDKLAANIFALVHLASMVWRQALGWPRFGHGPFLAYSIQMVTVSGKEVVGIVGGGSSNEEEQQQQSFAAQSVKGFYE